MMTEASTSFLKKSSKKLLLIWAGGGFTTSVQMNKRFLRAFFQKSAACFLPSRSAPHD
jgi:hypothetical protein